MPPCLVLCVCVCVHALACAHTCMQGDLFFIISLIPVALNFPILDPFPTLLTFYNCEIIGSLFCQIIGFVLINH